MNGDILLFQWPCFCLAFIPSLICLTRSHLLALLSMSLHVDGTLRKYSMQDNRLLARGTIEYTGKPLLLVPDADREALLVRDSDRFGQVRMLRKMAGGEWASRTLLVDQQMDIDSMCMLNANTLSIFDRKSRALRIYEFV